MRRHTFAAFFVLFGQGPRVWIPAPAERSEYVDQFAIIRGEHAFAGTAVVVIDTQEVVLQALTSAGTALFEVRTGADHHTVRAPDPGMTELLERLPFFRDLMLVYAWRCPSGRCSAQGGRIWEELQADGSVTRRWRGERGTAIVRLQPGRAELRDPSRGYTLVVVGEAVGR